MAMMEFSVHLSLPRERVWHYLYGDEMRHVPEVAPSIVEIRELPHARRRHAGVRHGASERADAVQ
jgi:hypothetical protein